MKLAPSTNYVSRYGALLRWDLAQFRTRRRVIAETAGSGRMQVGNL